MSNGTAALATLPRTSAPGTGAPAHTPDVSIERQIGVAVANAVCAIAVAMLDYQRTGALPRVVKDEGGSRIAQVVELQLGYCRDDFNVVARVQGKTELRQRLATNFYRQYSPEQGDAAIDLYIDGLLEITDRVIEFEKAWAH